MAAEIWSIGNLRNGPDFWVARYDFQVRLPDVPFKLAVIAIVWPGGVSHSAMSEKVKLGSVELFVESPLHPDQRTSSDRADWSVSCHNRK
jgi:hypothetical protein